MSYYDVYLARVNRFGQDYQSRIQNQREYDFEQYLLKTVYRVDFLYNSVHYAGALEPNKQDNSQTLQYLLVPIGSTFAPGTVLTISNTNWMIYWLDETEARGYNRYIVLKLTHQFSWKNRTGTTSTIKGYFYGPKNGNLKETIKDFKGGAYYPMDDNNYTLIAPIDYNLNKDDYIEIGTGSAQENYRVITYDRQSSAGIQYVSLDPVQKRDTTAVPTTDPTHPNDYYWFRGE